MWHAAAKRRGRGFTLVELLVALSLLALMSVLSYRAVSSALEAERRVRVEGARWSGLSVFFEQFERDAMQAVRRPVRDEQGRVLPAFMLRNQDSLIGEARVEWTRLGGGSGGEDDSRRVGYRLQEGRLQLILWPRLDRAPSTVAQSITLIEGVRELQLRVLAGNTWQSVWPQGNVLEDLPRAVGLHVVLDDGTTLDRLFPVGGE